MVAVVSSSIHKQTVAQDTLVFPENLCRTCTAFSGQSSLLHKIFNGNDMRIGTTEVFNIFFVQQMKSGYLNGRHLCALI